MTGERLCSSHQSWCLRAAAGIVHVHDGQICLAPAFAGRRGGVVSRERWLAVSEP